ncbi:hypothetical protein [Actinomadura harenae]|uniref:Uncharacterized protein n=1 Tax=Actinomadura harenae TaxID=2483351 RepID=A0A3M2LFV2_9ACTN|nr:hypothetical protein [Actinomadura harenae]RMI36391.1 hypothetical protein EBO15_38730 [Actinomadura harenae]
MWEKTSKRRDHRPDADAADLEAQVIAFGESLQAHTATPDDAKSRRDLSRALDAYDAATKALDGTPDAERTLRALHTGRQALDRLNARLTGRPRPQQLPLCFFDARHGPATTHARWGSSNGRPITIAVCAADALHLKEGRAPHMSRTVQEAFASELPGGSTTSHQVELPRERPRVLIVRTERPARVELRFENKDRRSSRFYALGGGPDPVVARVPAPGTRRTLRFTATFPDGEAAAWTVSAEPAHTIPNVDDDGRRGDGSDVIRFEGTAEAWILRHRGRGQVALEALDDDLAFVASVASGDGDVDLEFRSPGPGYYQLRAHGTWLLHPDRS